MAHIKDLQSAINKPASRWVRFIRDVAIDLGLIILSLSLAGYICFFGTSFDQSNPIHLVRLASGAFIGIVAAAFLFYRGLYSINVRYLGLGDFLNLVLSGILSGFGLFLLQFLHLEPSAGNVRFVEPLLFGFFVVALLASVRVIRRMRSWRTLPTTSSSRTIIPKRTLIVGAGDAGEMIMREISRSPNPAHRVVGFIDDDPEKSSLRIHGVRVLGPSASIPTLVRELHVEELVLALPSAKGEDMRRIIAICQDTGARIRTLPAVKTILSGSPHLFAHLREVDIEDLLRREPVQTNLDQISGYIGGERVLITGGGGSIGSELARQISQLCPASLTLLGKGENSIYEIEQELLQSNRVAPNSVVADVRDRLSMERVFRETRPAVVLHTAAHKHVPLMQGNAIEAIRNNVWGTWLTAEMAIRHGASRFIYVSTDKAVKPKSIMGASKRVGEMIILSLSRRTETEFSIVRFGNVLGSRGSLVPLLKSQIKRGGPVRVTHPEMTRYFMTIPEAVQLILQAGAIGKNGEIFLLEMGEPVKILDLARDLIRLHGLVPDEDIVINFTGVRPGEKIHEELLYEQENLSATQHPKIRAVRNGYAHDWEWLRGEVEHMLDLCEQGKSEEAHNCLMELAWGKTAILQPSVSGPAVY